MNIATVIHGMGHLLMFLAAVLLVPTALAYFEDGPDLPAFVLASFCTFLSSLIFQFTTRKAKLRFTRKEGFGIVAFGWVLVSFFGCLPFVFADLPKEHRFSFVDAYFETMSGFTTTGASILGDIESLPRGLLFWRSFTHWLGGAGIVVLSLIILPSLGAGGLQLFRAETTGPTKDKLSPKTGSTAKTLYAVYVFISLTEFICLWAWCGLDWFDSICQTFGTVATGGFSNKNLSIAAFDSWRVEIIVTFFSFLCGCNFFIFVNLVRGKWAAALKNNELWTFVGIIAGCTAFMTLWNHQSVPVPSESLLHTLRRTAFQVVTMISTTGFCTDDYDLWPRACQLVLFFFVFIGGCTGSTSGGLKVFRLIIFFKAAFNEVYQRLQPKAVLSTKVDGRNLSESTVRSILSFICLHVMALLFFYFLLVAMEGHRFDLVSLLSICVSCQAGCGPGLYAFGPTDNYGLLSDASKWCLCFLMLLGRLELYSVLVLFHRDFWRR